ncbi:hypothetical protein P9705_001241 [Enterococcus faecalis]|nr:hypothetical protein [Enterococcus faecalis]
MYSEQIKKIEESLEAFFSEQYGQERKNCVQDGNGIVDLAFSDGVFDEKGKYEFYVQWQMDIKGKEERALIYNNYLTSVVRFSTNYESMIEDLGTETHEEYINKALFYVDLEELAEISEVIENDGEDVETVNKLLSETEQEILLNERDVSND